MAIEQIYQASPPPKFTENYSSVIFFFFSKIGIHKDGQTEQGTPQDWKRQSWWMVPLVRVKLDTTAAKLPAKPPRRPEAQNRQPRVPLDQWKLSVMELDPSIPSPTLQRWGLPSPGGQGGGT